MTGSRVVNSEGEKAGQGRSFCYWTKVQAYVHFLEAVHTNVTSKIQVEEIRSFILGWH